MAHSRFRAVFLFLVLALVLTTTGCRGTSSSRGGHSSGSGLHLPWFSTSHEPDPTESTVAELRQIQQNFEALNRQLDKPPLDVWEAPLEPVRVTRPFQPPPSPYAAGHRGVDLAGSPHQQVWAAGFGMVTWAGVLAGRGVVVVSHGEMRTTYEPVKALVKAGQSVAGGDVIGALQPGHPGCPVAACLHWGLIRGADYLDPMSLLTDDVRLLPLDGK
jgi:murein DD-endopeptidase MepM/ murein hydrolase activator NlpD